MSQYDLISQALVRLLTEERFYAEIMCQMERHLNRKFPAIAGVCIKSSIELHINPDLFCALTIEERVGVLRHECEHILRDHIPRFKELAPGIYDKHENPEDQAIAQMRHKNLNIAADMAINYGLPHLHEGAVYPKTFDLSDGHSMEQYMAWLKDNEKAKGMTEFDGHPLWAESEGSEELLREKVRHAINKAAERTRAAGKLSSEHELLVNKLNQNLVNWRQQLRKFVARSQETKIDTSRKKRNRRYGLMYPGIIKEDQLYIGVAMDTSGSVSDESITQFMSEIHNISKYATIFIVEADSEIKNSYLYDPKKKYAVKGRGGTAYKPVFDFFEKHDEKIDGLIYFGDMDCFDKEDMKKPNYPVLWAIVGSQEPPCNFGSKIRIKDEQ